MKHPYQDAPDHRLWRRAVAGRGPKEVALVPAPVMRITREQPIMTAGSCFAQHIARHLARARYNFLVTEPGHPVLDDTARAANGYGLFTARYGNVYTSRQLLQLIERAYGRFQPADDAWRGPDGRFYDPFRPTVQPGGFDSLEQLQADRVRHFAAVRQGFETCEVFIFTLGLTEAWLSRKDGAAYPLCPGVAAGEFHPKRHLFRNLTAKEVIADMTAFIKALREVNPGVKVILTVSPVPLMATAEDQHVLVATTYSKAVLRVAAETLRRKLPEVYYFPSYEMITGAPARGAFFEDDLRSIREDGVNWVMNTFFVNYTDRKPTSGGGAADDAGPPRPAAARSGEAVAQILCDEELLDPVTRES